MENKMLGSVGGTSSIGLRLIHPRLWTTAVLFSRSPPHPSSLKVHACPKRRVRQPFYDRSLGGEASLMCYPWQADPDLVEELLVDHFFERL